MYYLLEQYLKVKLRSVSKPSLPSSPSQGTNDVLLPLPHNRIFIYYKPIEVEVKDFFVFFNVFKKYFLDGFLALDGFLDAKRKKKT